MLNWLFGDLILYLAYGCLVGGILAIIGSMLIGFLPMLKPHAVILKVVGILLIISGGYYVSYHHGYEKRVLEDQAEIERLNGEARAKEAQLDKQKQATNVALRKAKDAIIQKQFDINKRIDSGELRLSTSSCLQTNADARTTTGSGGGGQSESDRQTIRDIVQIAAEGDKAIIERNACIDFYNSVRSKVNEVGN